MFWGLVLKANKRYSQQVTKAFHVSQATLDLSTLSDKDAFVQVWLHTDDTDHLLANVNHKTSQVSLDLAFTEGETVAFYSKGNGTVHLSGYLMPEDDEFGNGFPMGEEEEEDEEDEEESDLELEVQQKKQKEKASKKPTQAEDDEDDDESDDLDFDGLQEELEDEEMEDEEDSDDDEDDDDDDDDDEEEEDSDDDVTAPPAKLAKFDKNAKQNGLTNGKGPKNEQKQQKNQQKNQKQEKQDQKQKNQQQQNQPQKKTLTGGVVIEDIRVGKGPEAKNGKKVAVYYEGRLKSNNKVFDSTKAGEGFKFVLGKGEVIRGWDVGVAGMKVGSKRRITIPPNFAYGPKGAPPQIPGNSTLVFEVELRGVN